MEWILTDDSLHVDHHYLYGSYEKENIKQTNKIAGFDLDNTIITTKSGRIHSKDVDDWQFINASEKQQVTSHTTVCSTLKMYYDNDYKIVIISNQKGLVNEKLINRFKEKLDKIAAALMIPFEIYVSIKDDIYRKPMPTFGLTVYTTLNNNIKSSHPNSFYCGDAAGRVNDFADTDYKFALNIGAKFYLPEDIFNIRDITSHDNPTATLPAIPKHPLDNIPAFDKSTLNTDGIRTSLNTDGIRKLILLVGLPGSGKTTYYNTKLKDSSYQYINMDTLKTKQKCLKMTKEYMCQGLNIVVDNTNVDVNTRAQYINLAKEVTSHNNYRVICLVFTTPLELCQHNNYYRHYISKGSIPLIPIIAYRIAEKKYQKPTIDEGIKDIIEIPFYNDNKDINYKKYYV